METKLQVTIPGVCTEDVAQAVIELGNLPEDSTLRLAGNVFGRNFPPYSLMGFSKERVIGAGGDIEALSPDFVIQRSEANARPGYYSIPRGDDYTVQLTGDLTELTPEQIIALARSIRKQNSLLECTKRGLKRLLLNQK